MGTSPSYFDGFSHSGLQSGHKWCGWHRREALQTLPPEKILGKSCEIWWKSFCKWSRKRSKFCAISKWLGFHKAHEKYVHCLYVQHIIQQKKGVFHKWGARQASIGWWLFHGKTLNGGRSPTARAQRGSSARLAAAGEGLAMTLQGILGVETHRKIAGIAWFYTKKCVKLLESSFLWGKMGWNEKIDCCWSHLGFHWFFSKRPAIIGVEQNRFTSIAIDKQPGYISTEEPLVLHCWSSLRTLPRWELSQDDPSTGWTMITSGSKFLFVCALWLQCSRCGLRWVVTSSCAAEPPDLGDPKLDDRAITKGSFTYS